MHFTAAVREPRRPLRRLPRPPVGASQWAATLGAVGKSAIHPGEIEIADEVFAPTIKEIDLARRMCEAYAVAEKARAAGADGVLIDATTVRVHEAVLERARLSGRA